MPASEAYLDAPINLRCVRHAEAFSDVLAGVVFVAGVAQSGMPPSVLSRLMGLGLPLSDLGPWDAVPVAPDASAEVLPSAPPPAPSPSPYVPPSRRR